MAEAWEFQKAYFAPVLVLERVQVRERLHPWELGFRWGLA